MTSHYPASRPRLDALTGARGPAALMVFAQHAGEAGFLPFVFPSSLAVSFFFVLSGFVLAYAYAEKPVRGLRFYRARFARIWPATMLSTLLVLLILPSNIYLPQQLGDWSTGWILLLVILMLQSLVPIPDSYFAFNAVTWSISVEWCFYLLFPLLNRGVRLRTIMTIVAVAILGAAMTFVAIKFQLPSFDLAVLAKPTWHGMVYINPGTRLFEFALGIVAGQLWLNPTWRQRMNSMFDTAETIALRMGATCLELMILASLILMLTLIVQIYSVDLGFSAPLQLLLFQWVSAMVLSLIVITLALGRGFFARRVISHPAMLRLGELSFGIYLFHQPLLNWFNLHKANNGFQLISFEAIPKWCYLPIVLTATLIMSVASHDWLETPAQRYLKGLN